MQHTHGPNCGCAEYAFAEEGDDLGGCIEIETVTCLNERIRDSCRGIFKAPEFKFEKVNILESNDDDAELLLIIPFNQTIKLKSFSLISTELADFPDTVKLYINQENVDFSYIEDNEPIQEVKIGPNLDGSLEYANVNTLIIHLSSKAFNRLSISYMGFKGIKTKLKRQAVNTTYESKPMLSDHKTKGFNQQKYDIS